MIKSIFFTSLQSINIQEVKINVKSLKMYVFI